MVSDHLLNPHLFPFELYEALQFKLPRTLPRSRLQGTTSNACTERHDASSVTEQLEGIDHQLGGEILHT